MLVMALALELHLLRQEVHRGRSKALSLLLAWHYPHEMDFVTCW